MGAIKTGMLLNRPLIEATAEALGGAHSLLLIAVPIEALQEQVPALKARWLNGGDTATLLDDLRRIAEAVWSLELEPRQPLRYMRLH